jgi:ABC-type sugar transport system ATPase subunit
VSDDPALGAALGRTGAVEQGVRALGVQAVTHSYGAAPVLQGVDFEMSAGEVHSLVGQNGSGKSTLIKILSNDIEPTVGSFVADGRRVSHAEAKVILREQLSVVHQDYNILPNLTVAANVAVVGESACRTRFGGVDWKRANAVSSELCADLGVPVDPRAMVGDLGAAEVKMVEIARAMIKKPRYLILDEPTASLEPGASARVLELIESLAARGVGILFVSHRLDEVLTVSHRITVLRDGQLVATKSRREMTADDLADHITGGAVVFRDAPDERKCPADGPVAVQGRNVRLRPQAQPFDLEVREGEILGLVGLLGAGGEELIRALAGLHPYTGEIAIHGVVHECGSLGSAHKQRIGYIPEDRGGAGLIADHSVTGNLTLPSVTTYAKRGILNGRRLSAAAGEMIQKFGIKTPNAAAPVASLSGGNQQKVLMARWLAAGVKVLLVEEPTHGVDIGAKSQIHFLIRDFVNSGGTAVVATTDLDEAVTLCDRIALMRHGSVSTYWERPQHEEAASARLLSALMNPHPEGEAK